MTSKYTPERILEAIKKVTSDNPPGMKFFSPALMGYTTEELVPNGYSSKDFNEAYSAVCDYFYWMMRNQDTSPLLFTKGKHGGWSLRDTQPTSNETEKPCFSCSRMNDLGVSKCWWCEAENPTK